jgi:hypothetical protein
MPFGRSARELVLPLLLAACAGASACGKREQSAAASAKGKSGLSDTALSCSVAPANMVGDVLGIAGLQQTNEKIDGKVTLCQYESQVGNANLKKFVSVRFERGYDETKFEGSKTAFVNPTDISGLGEKAFVSDMPMQTEAAPVGYHSVAVLKHKTHLTISAPVESTKVQYLARELLEAI